MNLTKLCFRFDTILCSHLRGVAASEIRRDFLWQRFQFFFGFISVVCLIMLLLQMQCCDFNYYMKLILCSARQIQNWVLKAFTVCRASTLFYCNESNNTNYWRLTIVSLNTLPANIVMLSWKVKFHLMHTSYLKPRESSIHFEHSNKTANNMFCYCNYLSAD